MKLTARQQQVLDVIRQYVAETGYPPTRADIARELGFKSANAAEEHLRALARKGAIEMIAGASRGIRLTESSGLPIIGRVAAGSPVLATEHIEDYCELPPGFFSPNADYLLRVTGDSMKDVGILDCDGRRCHIGQLRDLVDFRVPRDVAPNDAQPVKSFERFVERVAVDKAEPTEAASRIASDNAEGMSGHCESCDGLT